MILTIIGVLVIFISVACKAFCDATWDNKTIHPGTKNDWWHLIGRVGLFVPSVLILVIATSANMKLHHFVVLLIMLALVSKWLFRLVVTLCGKGDWYG